MYDPKLDEPKLPCGQRRCTWVCLWILLALSCLVFAAGFLGPYGLNAYLQSAMKKQLVITGTDSPGFASFADDSTPDSVPIWFSAYAWNLTNPREFLLGAKPVLVQCGPYVYRENNIKFNFSWSADLNLMSYKTYEYFVFDPTQSVGDPDVDRVTTVSVPFQAVRAGLGGSTWWGNLAFDLVASMTNATLLTRPLTINELIFGYNDTLLEFVAKLEPGTPTSVPLQLNLTSLDNAAEVKKFDTFHTGNDDISNIMQYKMWQENETLTVWGSDDANSVAGTDATQFPPGSSSSENILAFVDTLYRKVQLGANATIDVEGVTLWRFGLLVSEFANITFIPADAAYYAYGPIGVLNLTTCSSGAPVFVSKPHFLDADQVYRDAVIGMSPSYDLHDTYIDVEPTTGTTMQAMKRLQINVKVEPQLLLYPNLTETVVPVVWFEEKATITASLASQFTGSVYLLQSIEYYTKWVGIGAGAGLIAIMLVVMISLRVRNARHDPDTRLLRERLINEARGEEEDFRSPLSIHHR